MSGYENPVVSQGFDRINKTTYLYTPKTSVPSYQTSLHRLPDLILMLAWMNGQPRPISKYTAKYQTLYPTAKILLITTTTPDVILRSTASMTKLHADALTILLALSKTSRILVHAFSNGGALTLSGLATDYKRETGVALPMDTLVLDSTPGRNHWSRAVAAFEAGLSKSLIPRLVGGMLIRLVLMFYYVLHHLFSATDRIEMLRVELNEQKLLSVAAERLYLFSDGDDMIADKDVKDHVEDARKKGYRVHVEEFSGTKHCSHVIGVGNERRYWTAIQKTWDKSSN